MLRGGVFFLYFIFFGAFYCLVFRVDIEVAKRNVLKSFREIYLHVRVAQTIAFHHLCTDAKNEIESLTTR